MSAYGLTEREQQLTRLVLQGYSTLDIADRLVISVHTVQGHLRNIFTKTGVRARRDLVTKIFFGHYEPRLRDNEQRTAANQPLRGGPAAATSSMTQPGQVQTEPSWKVVVGERMGRSLRSRAAGEPTDRHTAGVEALRRAVFESSGSTEPSVRAAAGSGAELPEPLGSYAATVRDRSYRITDTDLAGLTAAGLSDDAIFEITIAAAVGAALQRLDAGMRAIRGRG